jgi:MFS family permease
LILYVFTVTFSAVDWAESLETDWYSTIWGFLFVAGQGLAAFAFIIIAMALLARREPLASRFKPSHLHDLGKLLLTFVMLWAYFAFSQLLIIWSGNLTDEIPWYLRRLATTWGWLGVALIVLQFLVPFLLLLSRPLKRNVIALSCVVGIIIVMRFVDLMWIVMPSYYQRGLRIHWLNFCVPLAIGGLWIATFVSQLKNRPLLPVHAPGLEKALHHGDD